MHEVTWPGGQSWISPRSHSVVKRALERKGGDHGKIGCTGWEKTEKSTTERWDCEPRGRNEGAHISALWKSRRPRSRKQLICEEIASFPLHCYFNLAWCLSQLTAKQIEKDELLPQGLTLCTVKWPHANQHCPCALSEVGWLVSACPLCF